MRKPPAWRPLAGSISVALLVSGCMIGPDYVKPPAPTASKWIEYEDPEVSQEAVDYSAWWTVFNDPFLNTLVATAYRQNLPLRIAGIRILQARARRGIAIGTLFPQLQQASGGYNRVELSENRANQGGGIDHGFNDWQFGFDAAWELDLWGRFRRGIQAADAELIASVASYDDVLVILIGEVAATYVQIRTLQEQLAVAESNSQIQERSLQIATAKFRHGMVTELDVAQAKSLLRNTQARIPALEASVRQSQNALCVLLGIPPRDLQDMLAGSQPIPTAPAQVAVGIPAELLRRRPDIRRSESEVAAQSAQIGIALADLYPRFSLVGTISIAAEDFGDLYTTDSFENFGGPTFQWAILNYGRIRNNVRVQDAAFQELVVAYENTVLRAQQEVEDGIAGYLGAQRQLGFLADSVTASERAVHLANIQYREGEVDYTRVLNTQQVLLAEQDSAVVTKGSVALNLIATYKALGGGWELRRGKDFVPEETKEEMRERTNWGGILSPTDTAEVLDAAASGAEADGAWWRWEWLWPEL